MNWKRSSPTDCPSGPAVYKVFLEGRLVYIGRTVFLRGRIQSHFRYPGLFKGRSYRSAEVRYSIVRCEDERKIMEKKLIRRFRPEFNQMLNPNQIKKAAHA